MPTRSGEVLSACVAGGVATGIVLTNDSLFMSIIKDNWTSWIALAYMYTAMSLFSALTNKLWYIGRFLSGMCWGSLLMLLVWLGKPYPLTFIAGIMFGFDMFVILVKDFKWKNPPS